MTRGLIFWVIMLVMLILAVCFHFALLGAYGPIALGVIAYILFALLGWQVFGAPIEGLMFSFDRISRIYKYLEENPTPEPHAAGSGLLQLSNGLEITGTWSWHSDLGIVRVVDTGGKTWIVDVEAIVAFSPITAVAVVEQPPAQS